MMGHAVCLSSESDGVGYVGPEAPGGIDSEQKSLGKCLAMLEERVLDGLRATIPCRISTPLFGQLEILHEMFPSDLPLSPLWHCDANRRHVSSDFNKSFLNELIKDEWSRTRRIGCVASEVEQLCSEWHS